MLRTRCATLAAFAAGGSVGVSTRRALLRVASGLRRVAAAYCVVCQVEPGDPVCLGCLRDFFDPGCPRCTVCGARLSVTTPATRCGRCLTAPPAFNTTIVLGDYAPPLDGMVMALKAGGRLDLARAFGHLLAERVGPGASLDCLLPVPLADRRQRERGFNQSMEIARAVARHLAVPLLRHTLVRHRAGPPQQSLALEARRGNVHGAFGLSRAVERRRAAVVDDVMTSGATLDEVATVLKRSGVAEVVNLVVARTP